MCILIDYQHKALINSKSGEKVYPKCFDDLMSYCAYLNSSGKHGEEQAEQRLKDVFKGERVMTELVHVTKKGHPKFK